MKLLLHAAAKLIAGFMLLAVLLFWPAGTWYFWNAWLLCGALFAPMIAVGLLLWKKAPQLLEKRLNGREQQAAQKLAVALSGAAFIGVFVAAGLDFRLQFTRLPAWLSVAALVPFLLGYLLYAETMRENAWLSRSVEVQQGQKLVDTGLYGVVRHPMYTATLLLFCAMPLILGSGTAFALSLLFVPIFVLRIRNEESMLRAGLDGYDEYCRKVRWRLFPRLW